MSHVVYYHPQAENFSLNYSLVSRADLPPGKQIQTAQRDSWVIRLKPPSTSCIRETRKSETRTRLISKGSDFTQNQGERSEKYLIYQLYLYHELHIDRYKGSGVSSLSYVDLGGRESTSRGLERLFTRMTF